MSYVEFVLGVEDEKQAPNREVNTLPSGSDTAIPVPPEGPVMVHSSPATTGAAAESLWPVIGAGRTCAGHEGSALIRCVQASMRRSVCAAREARRAG